ncbi:MAG: Methylated-DNA--protein-cysteine methyltransferase [Chlamydiales bacterium]|nr:Methylated-DNA--protein-cysteine methyltransferase [Chlamydiales bacterium]MCH9619376.1 Methylated-DNA--protein-cysteine methyltransferase [Chlamydiales bacterium]MCH9622180.1 Methylated-DNA--protein-cysteine methyltransferase [Chlamydiales bacterium]
MKKIGPKPKILVRKFETSITLELAPAFLYEGDETLLPWLLSYAKKRVLPLPPLPLDHLPPFTQGILKKLITIPFGTTLAYSAVDPSAPRAVGQACGRNPYPLLIPCHRVTAKHSLGGFALDLNIKKRLLEFEKPST